MDTLEVQVEVSEQAFANADEVRFLQNLEKALAKDLRDYLGVTAKIKLVEPKSLQRFEGKASRLIDNRKI
jgi:phenylacetate-CoA ligase